MSSAPLRRVARALAPVAVLSLLLTGCMDDDDEQEPVAVPEPPTLEECVVGSWKQDNEDFQAMLDALSGGFSMTVSGDSYLRFDGEGTFYSWRDDFRLTTGSGAGAVEHVSNSAEMGEYGVVVGFTGLSGTHPTDFLWVAETMTVMTDEVLTVGGIGQVIDTGGATQGVEIFGAYDGDVPRVEGREAMEGSVPVTCSGDLMTLEVEIGTTVRFHRSEVRYE